MNIQIGKVNRKVIDLLELEFKKELPIFLGDSNIEHMKRQHLEDYNKYGYDIKGILSNPTYVAKNPNQGSIEYIKDIEYKYDVVFPFGSSESPRLNGYHFKIKRKIYDIYFYNCEVDPECNAKENKKNNIKGYIIYDEYLSIHK